MATQDESLDSELKLEEDSNPSTITVKPVKDFDFDSDNLKRPEDVFIMLSVKRAIVGKSLIVSSLLRDRYNDRAVSKFGPYGYGTKEFIGIHYDDKMWIDTKGFYGDTDELEQTFDLFPNCKLRIIFVTTPEGSQMLRRYDVNVFNEFAEKFKDRFKYGIVVNLLPERVVSSPDELITGLLNLLVITPKDIVFLAREDRCEGSTKEFLSNGQIAKLTRFVDNLSANDIQYDFYNTHSSATGSPLTTLHNQGDNAENAPAVPKGPAREMPMRKASI